MLEGTDLSSAYSSMSGMASGGMNDSYSQEEELPPMKQPKQEKASRDDTNIIYKQATMDNSNNDQKLAALMTELKKKKAAQATEEQPSYFDKLFGKKKELYKILQLSLMITLGISIHYLIDNYLVKYLADNEMSFERQLLLRVLYPIALLFILWNLRVFVK